MVFLFTRPNQKRRLPSHYQYLGPQSPPSPPSSSSSSSSTPPLLLTHHTPNPFTPAALEQWPMLLFPACILLFSLSGTLALAFNSSLPFPDPDSVAADLASKLEASHRRSLTSTCLTGNPIDDCWRCSSNWASNRQRLAECSIGFGQDALGGKGGEIYVVTDSSDSDPVNPKKGTLRYAVIQDDPLWITFSSSMTIRLAEELIVNSFKTIDGRGADVHITGGGCITLQYVSNIIIHNVHIHNCVSAGNANIRSTPTHFGYRGKSDGDGISIFSSRKIWIDHCALSNCADGLIDVIMGSTGITISNNYFSDHDDVMLFGHDDNYAPDSGMQVTIAFNRFGEKLTQRMPRIRRGYVHVVNNDYTGWGMYAIGGSAAPTVNSQGNRFIAPPNTNAKMVTRREGTDDWQSWNWRSEDDILVNGAIFVPSGAGLAAYAKASSVEPKSAGMIDQVTMFAGVLGGQSRNGGGGNFVGVSTGNDGSGAGAYGGSLGMYFGGFSKGELSAPPRTLLCFSFILFVSLLLFVPSYKCRH